MLVLSNTGFASVFTARSFATHFAGYQYCTCESWNPANTNRLG